MKNALTFVGVALAFAAVPSGSTAQPASPVGLDAMFISENGKLRGRTSKVIAARILPGGTGELMGLRPGDVITQAGETRITSVGRLKAFIRKLKVGDPVELTVERNGERLQLNGTALARRR